MKYLDRRIWLIQPPKAVEYVVWQIKYGKTAEHLKTLVDAEDKLPDGTIPKAISDEPKLDMFVEKYVDAFYKLDSSRQIGMGVGAIPLSEILNYCEFLKESDADFFISIIQKIDKAYITEMNKE